MKTIYLIQVSKANQQPVNYFCATPIEISHFILQNPDCTILVTQINHLPVTENGEAD